MRSQLVRSVNPKFDKNLPVLNGSMAGVPVDALSDSFKKHLTINAGKASTAFFESPGFEDVNNFFISGKNGVCGACRTGAATGAGAKTEAIGATRERRLVGPHKIIKGRYAD